MINIAFLKEFSVHKHTIMKKLINLPNVINAIDPTQIDSADELLWKNIFPVHINPNTLTEKSTFITIDMYAPSVDGNMYKEVAIVFNVFADCDIQKMDTGEARTDYIASEIDEAFNGNDAFGIGYLELKSVKPLYVNSKYYGLTLIYNVTNFNHNMPNN